MIRYFIHFIHMRVERQCVVDGDAEASNASDTAIDVLPSDTESTAPSTLCRALVPMTNASDLSEFNDKPFNVIQPFTASKQRFKLKSTLVPSNAMYSDVSLNSCHQSMIKSFSRRGNWLCLC